MKTKKKLFVFNMIVIIIIITTSLYIVNVGDTYNLHSRVFYEESALNSIKVDASYSKEGIVEYVNNSFITVYVYNFNIFDSK